MIRYSTAHWSGGLRGAGLGNEALVWAKSFVGAATLRHHLLPPLWLLNKYRLHRQLGLSRLGMMGAHLASTVGATRVTEDLFLSAGSPDYAQALRTLAARGHFSSTRVLVHEGMWGGWRAVAPAREFLRQRLLAAPGALAFLTELADAPVPLIGLHVRRGDFSARPPAPGQFNSALPIEWYAHVMRLFREAHSGRVRFVVCSDATEKELSLLHAHDVTVLRGRGPSAPVHELLALSMADALIASVSSFSMLAAFLSRKPYVWYRDQLTRRADRMSIWDDRHAERARAIDGPDADGVPVAGRGVAVSASTQRLPTWLSGWVDQTAEMRRAGTDLLQLGTVLAPPADE